MRKQRLFSITILLTTIFLCSICFAGCSGSAQSASSDKKNDVVSFVANESKETLASQPYLIDKLANAALISDAGAVESDISDESVDDNDEYYDDSTEDYDDSDYEYSEDIEEQEDYDEPTVEEPVYEEPVYQEPVYEETVYEEPDYDEAVEDASDYEDEYAEEYYEEDYDDYSYDEYVWLSATGSKYHNKPDCGNMNPDNASQVTISYAEENGYEPCKKCF